MDKFDSVFWSEIPSNILSLRRVIQLLLKCSLAGRSLGSDSGIPFSKISGFLFKKNNFQCSVSFLGTSLCPKIPVSFPPAPINPVFVLLCLENGTKSTDVPSREAGNCFICV